MGEPRIAVWILYAGNANVLIIPSTKESNSSDYEIRKGIEGNLCRCTGYVNIIKSIKAAAKKMQTEAGKNPK